MQGVQKVIIRNIIHITSHRTRLIISDSLRVAWDESQTKSTQEEGERWNRNLLHLLTDIERTTLRPCDPLSTSLALVRSIDETSMRPALKALTATCVHVSASTLASSGVLEPRKARGNVRLGAAVALPLPSSV